MFSKWRSQEAETRQTTEKRKNRDRISEQTECKRILRERVLHVSASSEPFGMAMPWTLSMCYARQTVCPELFANVRSYNSRYVICARSLREFAPSCSRPISSYNDNERDEFEWKEATESEEWSEGERASDEEVDVVTSASNGSENPCIRQ